MGVIYYHCWYSAWARSQVHQARVFAALYSDEWPMDRECGDDE